MDADAAVERLRELLRVPTVSRTETELQDADAFARFPVLLSELYPRLHATLELERVGDVGLLYRWPGRTPGDALILMAHWDVVPADEPGWTHEPFAADLTADADGSRRLWGRGAIDDKGALGGILEAVEDLLGAGFVPENDVYLSFGGDEEIAGTAAAAAVDVLLARGIAVEFVLDEGGAVVQGQFPGVSEPTAVIGIAEKGIATIELRAAEPGGHAAHPPRSGVTATSRLARAIQRVSRQVPAGLPPTAFPMFAALGSRARGILGLAYRHPRLFRPVLLRALTTGSDEANALVRTTRVVTRLRGAAADNVLPEVATAHVNMRVVVGSTLDAEVARIRRDIADAGIGVRVLAGSDPPPVAPATGRPWERLVAALASSHPESVPVPYAMLGATDGRHFTRLTPAVYRFTPFEMTKAELAGLHAIDESIRVDAYLRGIAFYRALLESA
ncbi:M20/M25/M40 family metallo-hydrolase [Pseudolysinimonas sp.]|uniref:M20/M25/M40 family metallo-hydrolase n=1 Tax=Pseudolysinimonas sp. TaxID=2680009 RepID=UPI00378386AE